MKDVRSLLMLFSRHEIVVRILRTTGGLLGVTVMVQVALPELVAASYTNQTNVSVPVNPEFGA